MKFPYVTEALPRKLAIARFNKFRDTEYGTAVIRGCSDQPDEYADLSFMYDETPEELVAKAAEIDVLEWLAERKAEEWGRLSDERVELIRQFEPNFRRIVISDAELVGPKWPENVVPLDSLCLLIDLETRAPLDQVVITVLPTNETWQAACYLKIGGYNDMPLPQQHSALWKYWQQQYGASIAGVRGEIVEFTVKRPPKTREDALVLAKQHWIYCGDLYQEVGSVERLAARLLNAPVWFFWWD